MDPVFRHSGWPAPGVWCLLTLALTVGAEAEAVTTAATGATASTVGSTVAVGATPRRGARWEVQIVQPDGRRQVFAGRRERSRDSRVFVLAAEGPATAQSGGPSVATDSRRICPGAVERIEGGFVAPPRASRCAAGPR